MVTRAKFVCYSVMDYGATKLVTLNAVTKDTKENKEFWKYTPSGKIEMSIDNPPASSLFSPGNEYYVDFTLASGGPE